MRQAIPKPVQLRRPPLWQVCLDVRPGSEMFGSVNGRRCTIVLDSGCSENFIFISLAEELGLLAGEERTKTINVHSQKGTREMVILLNEVVVTFEGQVEFLSLSKCFPRVSRHTTSTRNCSRAGLRRDGAIQTFGKGRSRLYT